MTIRFLTLCVLLATFALVATSIDQEETQNENSILESKECFCLRGYARKDAEQQADTSYSKFRRRDVLDLVFLRAYSSARPTLKQALIFAAQSLDYFGRNIERKHGKSLDDIPCVRRTMRETLAKARLRDSETVAEPLKQAAETQRDDMIAKYFQELSHLAGEHANDYKDPQTMNNLKKSLFMLTGEKSEPSDLEDLSFRRFFFNLVALKSHLVRGLHGLLSLWDESGLLVKENPDLFNRIVYGGAKCKG